ncbi:MAG TPA: hypothetical protein VNO14_15535 [Blastocatellia bacterium]|nr:hypothetical protein [Blastocatellia bacterium]
MKTDLTLLSRVPLALALLALLLAASSPLAAFTGSKRGFSEARSGNQLVCGFDPSGADEHFHNHRLNRRRLEAQMGRRDGSFAPASTAGPQVEKLGNLALIRDDGTVVLPPSKFDLKNSSLLFTPEGDGYRITRDSIAFNRDFGSRLTYFFGPGDVLLDGANDGYRMVELIKAPFPFFGVNYDRMYVGTNGFITFSRGDALAHPSIASHLSELPRIAPLWADLDATTKGAIYYNRFEDRYTVTWNAVAQSRGGGASTFQAVLYDDGRIGFVYKKVKARSSLIGISPGIPGREATALDLSSPPEESIAGPVFEFFSKSKRLDLPALTQAFYGSHQDVFDALFIWTDFAFDNGPGVAHSFNVRNDIRGIGLNIFDRGSVYGSPERLSTIITMGNIVRDWPDDPQAHAVGLNSAVSIVCHELGHRWLSYVLFDAEHDIKDDLLGRQFAHWSFFLDTRTRADGSFSSLMEGNAWRDNGNGTFTTVETAVNYFSNLDLYLMGLMDASEVGPLTYLAVDEQLKAIIRSKSPVTGFSMTATRKTATVEQIIEREGPRVPDATSAPRSFRIAFILLTEAGKTPSDSTLIKLDRYRDALVRYFSIATGRRASLESRESGESGESGESL